MWDPHAFGAAVQQARKARGLTQEQLGEKVGVTGQAVSKWETGESAPDLPVPAVDAIVFDLFHTLIDPEAFLPKDFHRIPVAASACP